MSATHERASTWPIAPTATALKRDLVADATRLGFVAVGVTRPDAGWPAGRWLAEAIAAGHHGDMAWMATTADRRASPQALWPEVRSVVMLAMSYAPERDPLDVLDRPLSAGISAYAQSKDYHDVLKSRLKQVAARFAAASGAEVKVFVDTAPLMEKPLAASAGLGWQGKHTNLVSRTHGSWLFLGALLTTAELPPDALEADHCGSCRRCLDVCPTAAFPAAYVLDARRCIAYLTIEHKGHIPRAFRPAIANRVFGCDDCLAVCPWNKFAAAARDTALAVRAACADPPIAELLSLDDAGFRARFSGTPVKRTGRDRVVRNALVAAGNAGDPALLASVTHLLDDDSALVRAMAVWALRRLAPQDRIDAETRRCLPRERDEEVRSEWFTEETDE